MELQKIDGCKITTATSTEDILSNIAKARLLRLPELHTLNEWRDHMPIAVVGGGPSLKDNLELLKKYKYIMACGSVYDYLIANDIIPTWCVLCDPDPLVNTYLKSKRQETIFLVASQCSQETFEYLKDNNTIIWHAFGTNVDTELFGSDTILIGGGCTVGTRAMVMSLGFGYYTQHLFGMDTCLSKNYDHHAYEFNDPDNETIGHIFEIKMGGKESPTFKVAGYMLGQLFDFQNLLKLHADTLRITVIGDSLLKYTMDEAKRRSELNNLTLEPQDVCG